MPAIASDTDADFLRAILAAPDDDAPRLIYADWLDENGLRWTWSLQLRTMLEMPLMVYDSEPAACEAAWKAAAAFVRGM